MFKVIAALIALYALVTPVRQYPQIEVPSCGYGGITYAEVTWKAPTEALDHISAVAYLFENASGQEVVQFLEYAGQVGGAHTWRVALPNPYPAYWRVHVSMYAGNDAIPVEYQNRPGGCGVFLPVVSR